MRIGLMFMLYESIVLPLNYFGVEPLERIGLSTTFLPRKYSTTELQRQNCIQWLSYFIFFKSSSMSPAWISGFTFS